MRPRLNLLRLPHAILATLWHAEQVKLLTPEFSFAKRARVNFWFFVMCLYGIAG